jgi:hypothetical protein
VINAITASVTVVRNVNRRFLLAPPGGVPENLALATALVWCHGNFSEGGGIADRPFQPRLPDGMIRC